jgi:transposase
VDKQQQQKEEEKGFTLVSLDESFFFYDSLVRRVWIDERKRPIVRVTGSHKHSCVFGALSLEGKQLFRQYERFNGDTFLEFLKTIHSRFPKCHLFMDKASPHYRSRKVIKYLEENKDTLIPVYLPTASPEFMVMEEVWNMAKNDLLVLSYYPSFADFKNRVSCYFRTKRFNLNMRKYLLRNVF